MTTSTLAQAVVRLKSNFHGCKCLGTVPLPQYGGDTEIYEIPGDNDLVGAWYADGALMLWPRGWVDSYRDSGQLGVVPDKPRSVASKEGSGTSEKSKDPKKSVIAKRGGSNRVLLRRGTERWKKLPMRGRGLLKDTP